MTFYDKDEFVKGLALFVAERIRVATEPLIKKIEEQEKRIEDYRFMQDAALKQAQHANFGLLEQRIKDLPAPKDGAPGKDADMTQIKELIKEERKLFIQDTEHRFEEMKKEMMPWEDGKGGQDEKDAPMVDVDDIVSRVIALVPAGKDGAPGKDGEPVILEDVIEALVDRDIVGEVVKKIPAPKDGKDGRNGLDAVSFYREDGKLNVVMSDGSIKPLGVIDGKDGAPGADGKSGRDGVAYTELEFIQDENDPRIGAFKASGPDGVKVMPVWIPGFIDKGVWRAGKYLRGDTVTLGGCMFIAQCNTEAEPGTKNGDWRQGVKRGRDGKDGEPGPKGDPGKPGKDGAPGRDLTQLGPDGKKW